MFLCDNTHQLPFGHDRPYKVRKFFDIFLPRFESEHNMHLCCRRGHVTIQMSQAVYESKPTKWDKVFVLADTKNGYIKKLQIYTSKDVNTSSN